MKAPISDRYAQSLAAKIGEPLGVMIDTYDAHMRAYFNPAPAPPVAPPAPQKIITPGERNNMDYIEQRIKSILSSPEYIEAGHPRHRDAVEAAAKLFREKYPDDNEAMKAMGEAQEIRGHLKEIISHPGYTDEGHPQHKELVQQAKKGFEDREAAASGRVQSPYAGIKWRR